MLPAVMPLLCRARPKSSIPVRNTCLLAWLTAAVAVLTPPRLTAQVTPRANVPPAPPAETVQVAAAASFDGRAFAYTVQLQSQQPRHRRYAVSYPSPLATAVAANNEVPAEYYVPADLAPTDPRRPAVIVLHILNGNFELERLLCTVLAEGGIPVILFKLPYYGERGGPEGRGRLLRRVDLFTQCLEQALLDVRRTADVLASRPEVDPARLGVCGISLGAILAAAACGTEPRLQRAGLILGGCQLQQILATARETRALRRALEDLPAERRAEVDAALLRIEPLTHARALQRLAAQDRLLMVNAAEDEVVPPACTRALAEAVGAAERVVWLPGLGHYTAMAALPQILDRTVAFFAADLPAGIVPPPAPPAAEPTPVQALVRILQQAVTMLLRTPDEGRCHLLEATATVVRDRKQETYHLAYARGSGSQFRLRASPVPEVGTLVLGNGSLPWLVSRDGTLFLGSREPGPTADLGAMLDPRHLLALQVLGGAVSALAVAPAAFADYLQVAEAPLTATDGAERMLVLAITHPRAKGNGSLRFRRDTLAPTEIRFTTGGVTGVVTIRQWAPDTVGSPELCREPAAAAVREVPREDLLRMFAATFGFLMEKVR
jgi:dienelactone hydrolase